MDVESEQIRVQDKAIDSSSDTIQAEMMREDKVMNILSQINPDNLITDIEHRLRGEKKNVYTNKWEKISEEFAPINEKMLVKLISFLGSILNQNVALSNFQSHEINSIMGIVIEWVADDLDVNDIEYGIENKYTEMTRIGNIVCISVFATLKQAQNGMLAKRIFSGLKVNANLTSTKEKGFRDMFKL